MRDIRGATHYNWVLINWLYILAVTVFLCHWPVPERKALAGSVLRRLVPGKHLLRLLLGFGLIGEFCAPLPAKPSEKITLTVAGFAYQAAEQLSREGLAEFSREAGVQVEFIPAWGNSTDQVELIRHALDHHFSTPDVYLLDIVWPGTLHQDLLDLRPFLSKEHLRATLPKLIQNDTIDGRIVSLPFYLNAGLLYYRTDLLKKYGYRGPPETWKELERMAARIQRGERRAGRGSFWGYVWQGGAYEGLTCNALEWQASFGGGQIIEPDGTVRVNNPQTAEALRMASAWVGSISPPSVLSYTEADSLNVFRSGNAAFLRYWTSGYRANNEIDSVVRGRFNVTLLPAGPHGRAQAIGGFQLAVSRYSAHPREAAELVLYLTSRRIQKARAIQEGYLPATPGLYRDPEVLRSVPEAAIIEHTGPKDWVSRPSSVAGGKYSAVSRAYYEAIHRALARRCSPETALDRLEKELAALMTGSASGDK